METFDFANGYAKDGYRTLILCKRYIETLEYEQWLN